MKLRGDARVRLDRQGPDLDLFQVFHALNDARFEREASRRTLAALDLPPELFDLDAIAHGYPIATDRLLWDVWRKRPSALELGDETDASAFELADQDLPAAAAALLELGAARDPDAASLAIREVASEELARRFAKTVARDPSLAEFPAIQEPGIYRREHASLVIRSRTTTLITDPQGGTQTFTSRNYPTTPRPLAADGVLITHLHEDHWAPASILLASRPDTRVIVPQVPRPSLLTPTEPVGLLAACQVDVVALPWWQSTTIGDIRVDALPFYGEQPTRTADLLPRELRNWGSCYRVETPEFSMLLLADSGVDPAGSMIPVIERITAERGPVDCVASCALRFAEAVNPGLPEFALVLPFEFLAASFATPTRPSVTSGPSGAAEACVAARARWFLPYAHGFEGLAPSRQDAIVDEVGAALAARRAATSVLRWNPGDVFSPAVGAQ